MYFLSTSGLELLTSDLGLDITPVFLLAKKWIIHQYPASSSASCKCVSSHITRSVGRKGESSVSWHPASKSSVVDQVVDAVVEI